MCELAGESPRSGLGLRPWRAGAERAPVRSWKASQPRSHSGMPPLGLPILDSALPSPLIPCWGALPQSKQPVMINSTDTRAFFPN